MQRFESSYGMSKYLFESFCDIECTIMFIGCRKTSLGSILRAIRSTFSNEAHRILSINAVDIVYVRTMVARPIDGS